MTTQPTDATVPSERARGIAPEDGRTPGRGFTARIGSGDAHFNCHAARNVAMPRASTRAAWTKAAAPARHDARHRKHRSR